MKSSSAVGASDHGARAHRDTTEIRERLISSHQEFLALVHRRVGSRTLAEGILRDAFGDAGDALASASDEESAVTWFVRKLREAAVAYQGRHEVTTRGLSGFVDDLDDGSETAAEIRRIALGAIARLTDNLDPVYARALQRVEIDGLTARDYASEAGLKNPHALVVRLYLAREALKKQIILACVQCGE